MMDYGRTGRIRFRQDWRGRQILQVEIKGRAYCGRRFLFGRSVLRWVDAQPSDAVTIMGRINGPARD